nr:hypothetical protein [Tanacetum cinerariifolium]
HIPPVTVAPAGQQVAPEILAAHTAWVKGSKEIDGLMFMTMKPEIQRNLKHLHAHEMIKELKTLFAQQAEHELLQTTKEFHSCRQEKGQPVSSYVLKMKGYIDNLEHLGHPVTLGLGTVNELHAMLKLHDQTLPKSNAPALNAIRAGKVQKGNKHKKSHSQKGAKGQNQRKGKYASKPKIPPPPKRENPTKDSIYHECREIGYWKRKCPQYLAELMKKKKNTASGAGGSGIFVIELNTILNRSWIYDTGCGTHICNTTQGLRASRKLKPGALSLYLSNGQREAVEAIVAFYLCLPSGLEIVLNNCHYAPSITRGVIYVSRLYEDGFVNRFNYNTIHVSRNNVDYFCAIPRDGILEIDLSNSLTNESSVYAVSNKRAKLDLDSTLLWHCRLGHISKKRIEKLQHDGLLNSSDLTSFEKCVSCMSGKMERKPYTHQVQRAKDLLGLIHTDVCGPFKIISRQGASYFITFTDDFSRYGYVYLLKHKHKVFETFKVFHKEVENQLRKTIKFLCSDRGGECMSQEFLDHLKDHGIIAYRTPLYTPQHNGVLERRNRTLLDMVRSMMSQTTLPKSFSDYALETATRILNMVPTKKVEKTPYEPLVTEFENLKMSDNGTIYKYAAKLLDLNVKETGFEDVVGRLKDYEERVKKEDKANDAQHKLLYTRTDNFNRNIDTSGGRGHGSYSHGRGKGYGRGKSQNQGQHDYSKNHQDNKHKGKKQEQRGLSCIKYYRCDKFGHFVSRCPDRKRDYEANLNET